MAPMRQQPIQDEGWPAQSWQAENWNEADAMRLVRGFGGALVRTSEAPRHPRAAPAPPQTSQPTAAQVDAFVDLLLHASPDDATLYVEGLRDAGTPFEQLYLGLLTTASRRLGAMWDEDACDSATVTLAALHLATILRRLGPTFCGDTIAPATAPSALLAQMPGEQHGLGLTMVVQFFRRAGWTVREAPAPTSEDLVDLVRGQRFGVVGLSVSCTDRLEQLAADIRAIRLQSKNPAVGVMVGGPPFVAHPQLAAMVGADATAMDARQAVRQAECLVGVR